MFTTICRAQIMAIQIIINQLVAAKHNHLLLLCIHLKIIVHSIFSRASAFSPIGGQIRSVLREGHYPCVRMDNPSIVNPSNFPHTRGHNIFRRFKLKIDKRIRNVRQMHRSFRCQARLIRDDFQTPRLITLARRCCQKREKEKRKKVNRFIHKAFHL